MTPNADAVVRAIQELADDRGFVRTSVDDLVGATGLGRTTVKRLLEELAKSGRIEKRSKSGPTGGLLIRSTDSVHSVQNSVQNGPNHHVSEPGDGPRRGPKSPGSDSVHSVHSAQPSVAYRDALMTEIPESGATLIYTNEAQGHWVRLNASLWRAPNGDCVSVKSMTHELRIRLDADRAYDEYATDGPLAAVRTILDR